VSFLLQLPPSQKVPWRLVGEDEVALGDGWLPIDLVGEIVANGSGHELTCNSIELVSSDRQVLIGMQSIDTPPVAVHYFLMYIGIHACVCVHFLRWFGDELHYCDAPVYSICEDFNVLYL
ncbi:unnamed protein product, partial [Urochloa humidicola]